MHTVFSCDYQIALHISAAIILEAVATHINQFVTFHRVLGTYQYPLEILFPGAVVYCGKSFVDLWRQTFVLLSDLHHSGLVFTIHLTLLFSKRDPFTEFTSGKDTNIV